MKKNQVLQLLLVLQLVIVVVLLVSFWDRYGGSNSVRSNANQINPVQLTTTQAGTCNLTNSMNSCNSCGNCQTQRTCSTCAPQIVNDQDIQNAVENAVDDYLESAVQGVLDSSVETAVDTALDSTYKGFMQESVQELVQAAVPSMIQTGIQTSIQSEVQTAINGSVTEIVNNTVDTAVNTALGTALQDAETRILSTANEMIGRNIEDAQLQSARAYDPNSADSTTNASGTAQTPVLEVPENIDSVPDAVKVLAAEQTDEFDALASRTSNFRSTENSFETSSDILFEGSALKFKPETSEDVLTVFRGGAVDDDGVFIFKRFGEDHTILAVNSPPSTAPFYGKESTLALVRGDEPNVEVVDFYNQDYPEAGVRQAGIRVIKEVGPDVTKSEWLPFAIDFAAHSTETKETTEFEVLKITPPSPQANVQVNGYMQIDVVDAPGAPPLEDCDAVSEHGRMKVDPREGVSLLYICTSDGWVAK